MACEDDGYIDGSEVQVAEDNDGDDDGGYCRECDCWAPSSDYDEELGLCESCVDIWLYGPRSK